MNVLKLLLNMVQKRQREKLRDGKSKISKEYEKIQRDQKETGINISNDTKNVMMDN